ncbi:hypothetical protein [Janthinobacterium sp. 1_2014MBL_MicDiv]|uniref:hypothetical protein n=1 Tax=Janthinobacterium sp. 1_2014MBL_MicDiv TaxID=1644131 RepID=UPI0012EB1287|nr:hypothetical protein [Janthinobacterium sp. 1_2014MBL_MicDiv]
MRDSFIAAAFPSARFCQVPDLDELIFRIKESEIVAGQPGRVFYLGQELRSIRLSVAPGGFQVDPQRGRPERRAIFFTVDELLSGQVGLAMDHGWLFTRRVAGPRGSNSRGS